MSPAERRPPEVVATLARVERPKPPLDRALDAIEELVEESVRTARRTRFSEASRYCKIGQELLRVSAEGVADVVDGADGGCGDGFNYGGRINVGYGVPARDDGRQVIQDQIGMLKEMFDSMRSQTAARGKADRAGELESLTRTLDRLRGKKSEAARAFVQSRVDAIYAEMATETTTETRGASPAGEAVRDGSVGAVGVGRAREPEAVVPTELPRRRAARGRRADR